MAKLVRVDRGNWAKGIFYSPGNYAIYVPTGIVWNCAIMHTSAAEDPSLEFDPEGKPCWRIDLQVIPSGLKYFYDGNLTPLMPSEIIRGRYPWHVTQVQEGGPKESTGHKKQRGRWKAIRDKFKTLTEAERQRWYAAAPPWHSLLFYYNYFMMSGLMGNANLNQGGCGVIKNIQHKTISMPQGTGEGEVAITAVDPAKTIVMIFGNSVLAWEADIPVVVYPYVSSVAAELVKCKWSISNYGGSLTSAATISIDVIEYI